LVLLFAVGVVNTAVELRASPAARVSRLEPLTQKATPGRGGPDSLKPRAASPNSPATIDFATGVLPVLTKHGCNSGQCHGAAIGQGGLKLSLLGYDPAADYEALAREYEGRRVNRVRPEASLLLRKPTMGVAHGGGKRFDTGSPGYARLLAWLKAGLPERGTRGIAAVQVAPAATLLPKPGAAVALKVTATFTDGAREDVTAWALFSSNDDAVATVDEAGRVTAHRRGDTAIMVRYLGEVQAARVAVPLGEQSLSLVREPATSFVDTHVYRQLERMRIPPSPLADDATFLRRAFLDLIGTLPAPEEARRFLADRSPERRARLVDALLARPEYVDLWTYKLGDLLRINSRVLQAEGARAYHLWVREQVARNTPFNQVAHALVMGLGDAYTEGPANFARVTRDPREEGELIAQTFMGVRLACANCHAHPFDRWTQDDYHGLAAAFARLNRGREVTLAERGEVTHPRTGKDAAPRIPGGRPIARDGDRRRAVAEWLAAPDNPFFAKATVNRLWKELMGRGLVEPVDDLRPSNPATNPELLDALARDFQAHGFDVKRTLRLIATSRTYQRSAVPTAANRADDRFHSHARLRPLPAPVLMDAIAAVTGVPESYAGLPPGTRAIALGDSRVPSVALDVLGRCAREAGGAPAMVAEGGLPQALHLVNGETLNGRLKAPEGRVAGWSASEMPAGAIVEEMYLRALSRPPAPKERAHWSAAIHAAADRRQILEDILWALLNSREFVFNH
jgi:hypothetical protein